MGWRDRDYNRGSEAMTEFFGNPASIFSWAVPFGNWFGSRVRLHFWLLLSATFIAVSALRYNSWANAAIYLVLLIACLLAHEFGHRICAELTGGRHLEFVLWPAGGMIPPHTVPEPWPFFIGNAGGILANLFLALLSGGSLALLAHSATVVEFQPLYAFLGVTGSSGVLTQHTVMNFRQLLYVVYMINVGLIFVNLLPYYWFDGAYLYQAILWPWLGNSKSIIVVCIAGMVLAVPLFFLSLWAQSILAMIMCVLLFSDSFMRRKTVKANGSSELQDAIAHSASMRDAPPARRRKASRRALKLARRRAVEEQKDQDMVDAILDKVHREGLHSLTRREKKALERASARQRRREP